MFYCGYDPGFEAYLANQIQAAEPLSRGHLRAVLVLLGLIVLGVGAVGLAAAGL